MDIAKHISDHRLSRAEICATAGISRAMLSLIEGGRRRIGVDKLEAFAGALGVSPESVRPDIAALFHPAAQGESA